MIEDALGPMPGAVPTLRIRRMVASDLAHVATMEARIFPFPWTFGNFVDALAAGYDCWVFESLDAPTRILAYAVVMAVADEAHLLNLSVDEGLQGRGLGGTILESLMRDARGRGLAAMLLEVRPSNFAALRLYERKGFHRIGLRRRYYPAADGQREDAIVMRCRWDGGHE